MAIVTIDIDLTKTAFAVHDVDEAGKPVLVRPDALREHTRVLMAPSYQFRRAEGIGWNAFLG